eukprot:m.192275 g.192275  ORF g.192275 m.192275 type:complete len:183 (-) comp32458_c6_seq1:75-623(-)
MSEDSAAQGLHPDLSGGLNGGVPEQFWLVVGNIIGFAQRYGWFFLAIGLVLLVFWHHIEPVYNNFMYKLTAPPPVFVDGNSVDQIRDRQQRRLLELCEKARLEREEARRLEALERAKNPDKGKKKSMKKEYKDKEELNDGFFNATLTVHSEVEAGAGVAEVGLVVVDDVVEVVVGEDRQRLL